MQSITIKGETGLFLLTIAKQGLESIEQGQPLDGVETQEDIDSTKQLLKEIVNEVTRALIKADII